MTNGFYAYFLDEIRRKATHNVILVDDLMAIIHLSKANLYKKINGEVAFSVEEVIQISRRYNISLDRFIHNGQGDFEKVLFDYSLPQHQPRSPLLFLEKIHHDLERIIQLPNPQIRYASNEVPIFHSLMCRNLLAFKLYVWSRTNWKLPEMLHSAFCPDDFYEQWPELDALRQSTYALYQQIPTTEYWPRLILNNILNQIRYYATTNLFQDPAMPAILLAELGDMLHTRGKMASEQAKNCLPDGSKGAEFRLFLNEIAYTNNIILVYNNAEPITLYTTLDNPNFMRTQDPAFCARMHHWVMQIEECSFPLSNEQHRISLFADLSKKVAESTQICQELLIKGQ